MAKAQRKQARDRKKMDPLLLGPPPTKRGDQATCDHLVTLDNDDIAIDGSRYGLLCRDRATKYLMVYPQALRNTDQTRRALAMFQGRVKIKVLHSDPAPEIVAAAKELKIDQHNTATPGRKEGNAIAERSVRTALEGTRGALAQSGMALAWWSYAIQHYCMSVNIHTEIDGQTVYKSFYHKEFTGQFIPFGALVDYLPHQDKIDQKHKFDVKTNQGVFLGYTITSDGWKGEYMVMDLRVLQEWQGNLSRYRTQGISRTQEVFIDTTIPIVYPCLSKSLREEISSNTNLHVEADDEAPEDDKLSDQDEGVNSRLEVEGEISFPPPAVGDSDEEKIPVEGECELPPAELPPEEMVPNIADKKKSIE